MPKLDPDDPALPRFVGSDYPPAFAEACAGLRTVSLGGVLEDFGVALVTVPPGKASSLRHWHPLDDEFVWMVSGTLTLVEDEVRTMLCAGDCAIFPKATGNGHHLVNESDADARFIAIGANKGGTVYPDDDLNEPASPGRYAHKDGTPY